MAQYPCRNCIYFKECGESTRTMPCVGRTTKTEAKRPVSAYERTKAHVYATGNKWAIENFHATHD